MQPSAHFLPQPQKQFFFPFVGPHLDSHLCASAPERLSIKKTVSVTLQKLAQHKKNCHGSLQIYFWWTVLQESFGTKQHDFNSAQKTYLVHIYSYRSTDTDSKKTIGLFPPHKSSGFTFLLVFQLCFADYFIPRQTGAPSMIIFAAKKIHGTYIAECNSKLSYLGTDNNMVLHCSSKLNLK